MTTISAETIAKLSDRQSTIDWDQFFRGYIQSLGFTAYLEKPDGETGSAFTGSGNFDENWDVWTEIRGHISDSDLDTIISDIDGFLESADELIRTDSQSPSAWEQAGTDFNFTRNHHGSGFWDGDWSNGKELTELSHPYGTFQMVINRDGETDEITAVYFHG